MKNPYKNGKNPYLLKFRMLIPYVVKNPTCTDKSVHLATLVVVKIRGLCSFYIVYGAKGEGGKIWNWKREKSVFFEILYVFVSEQRSYRSCVRQLAPQPVFASCLTFPPLGTFITDVSVVHTPILLRSGCIFDRVLIIVQCLLQWSFRVLGRIYSCPILLSHATIVCVNLPFVCLCLSRECFPFVPRQFLRLRVPNFHRLRGPASSDSWSCACLACVIWFVFAPLFFAALYFSKISKIFLHFVKAKFCMLVTILHSTITSRAHEHKCSN